MGDEGCILSLNSKLLRGVKRDLVYLNVLFNFYFLALDLHTTSPANYPIVSSFWDNLVSLMARIGT
jgi:hypothetical protein